MRLFIALDLPVALQAWIREQQEELKRFVTQSGLRWTPEDQWHVTLRFLGEWPEHRAATVLAAMKRVAGEMSPFSVSFGKLGTFSGPRMGVLWVGVEAGKERLTLLVERLNKELEAEGFPKEIRPFRGHVTLARSREKISSIVLKRYPLPPPCSEALIDRLNLYQSVLDSQGARYTLLHMVKLRGSLEKSP